VTRKDFGVIGQDQKFGFNRIQQLRSGSFGAVNASHRADEEGVSRKTQAVFCIVQTNSARGVSRCVKHLPLEFSDLQNISVFEHVVSRRRFSCVEHPQPDLPDLVQIISFGFVDSNPGCGFFPHLRIAHDMVHMAVGVDDLRDGQFVAVGQGNEFIHIVGRIHDNCLVALPITDQVSKNGVMANFELTEEQGIAHG